MKLYNLYTYVISYKKKFSTIVNECLLFHQFEKFSERIFDFEQSTCRSVNGYHTRDTAVHSSTSNLILFA